MTGNPDLEKARQYVQSRLEHELSPHLTYHSVEHTLKEVVPAVDQLATLEKLDRESHLLLLTAAYFHDLGFIYERQGHEAISIQLVEQILPGFGYTDDQIAVIRGIIQATCLPQSPSNLLERIMADADLDYLGHEDYWRRSSDFRKELDHYGKKFTDEEWLNFQLRFMQSHQYFTTSERQLRDAAKQKYIFELEQQLNELHNQ